MPHRSDAEICHLSYFTPGFNSKATLISVDRSSVNQIVLSTMFIRLNGLMRTSGVHLQRRYFGGGVGTASGVVLRCNFGGVLSWTLRRCFEDGGRNWVLFAVESWRAEEVHSEVG